MHVITAGSGDTGRRGYSSRVRAVVPFLDGDREPGPDLAAVLRLVERGALSDLAG